MNIVVLDGFTLNPGDLDWSPLHQLGDCEIYDRSAPDEVVERAKDADCLLTNKTVLDHRVLSQLPKLKYIGVLATGYNVVDLDSADKKGVQVTNTPSYTGLSGAQAVFALILELTNRVGHHSSGVSNGKWTGSKDFCYWDHPLVELDQLTLGIIGYGGIGRNVANIGRSFGMNSVVNTRTVPDKAPDGIRFVTRREIFEKSDIISLHCPLNSSTQGMINTNTLSVMKKTAFLVNISRGGLIVETDLATALNAGDIAGAALDVLEKEPPLASCPLLKAKNCFITPHNAWATISSRKRLFNIAIENLKAFMAGKSLNVVNNPEN